MESLVKDLLENVVGRLTKIETRQEAQLMRESQIDQVIERLDTIHNRQTQLEHKLSDVSTQLEQEKVFMRDQLKEAQDEILHRLSELQQQNVSTRSQAVSVGEEMKQLQATAGPNPVKETAEFCSQADGDVMDARLAKMSETLEQSVKAAIGVEAIWLSNQTDQRISELSDKVDELAKETSKVVESIKQENRDMATDLKEDVGKEIRTQNESIMKEVHESLTGLAEENRVPINQQREEMKTIYTEIVTQVKKTSSELPRILDEVKKEIKDHIKTVQEEIIADTNNAIVKMKDEYIEAQKQLLQDSQGQIATKGKDSIKKVTDELEKVKEELLNNTNSACQKLENEVIKSQNFIGQIETAVKESTSQVTDELGKVKEELSRNTNSACLRLKDTVIKAQTEATRNTQGHIETAVKKSTMQVTGELGKVKEELFKNTNSACLTMKDTVIKSQTGTIQYTQGQIEKAVKESTMKVTGELGKVKEELLKNTNSACQKLKDEVNKSHRETIQNIQSQIETSVKESTTKVTDRIGNAKEQLCSVTNSECQRLREVINSQDETIQKAERNVQSTVKESVDKVHTELDKVHKDMDKVHTDLDKTKCDLVALVEGQSQIVRDRIAGPLPQHKKYVCDFYIENFRQLVRSGKIVTSLPWHINQIDSSVRGTADFPTNGKMRVWLMHGRHPRQLGLPTRSGVTLKYKATITDTSGQMPDLVVGEVTWTWTEESIEDNKYWGKSLGEMSCDELIQQKYGYNECYLNSALLVRYEIEVL